MSSAQIMVSKANTKLMRHPETRPMCGIFVSGQTQIIDDGSLPTAATDGWNKFYSKDFVLSLSQAEVNGLVLHENLHVFCKHFMRFAKLMKTDAQLANAAMDYAINAWIVNLKDKTLAVLPKGGLYDPQFTDWSVQQIYEFLKKERDNGGQRELEGHDEHRPAPNATAQQMKDIAQRVDTAIQQGAVLAGAMGQELPRFVQELLVPQVDWVQELAQFASEAARGSEDYSFHRLNRRYLADDLYVPTMYSEKPSEVVLAIDTSGSIDEQMLKVWAGSVARIMESVNPAMVRVLWWDTRVHAEQLFTPDMYPQIADLLRPVGGGGTRVGSVNEYLKRNNVRADCVVVLTDGWVESSVMWDNDVPTLWAVTERRDWTGPAGRTITVDL